MSKGISVQRHPSSLLLLISLSLTQLLLLDLGCHSLSSSDSPMLSGFFKYHCRALDCLNYPSLDILTSPSAHSRLGHIPFSKQRLCFLIRQLWHSLLTHPSLTLFGSVPTQKWGPIPSSHPDFPISSAIRRCSLPNHKQKISTSSWASALYRELGSPRSP